MVPPASRRVPRVPRYSGYCLIGPLFVYKALTSFGPTFQRVPLRFPLLRQSATPRCSHHGLGSYAFARRYWRNRCFFLFLRLLRCFSSAGSLRMTMDSSYGAWRLSMRVSPFGYLRVTACLRLSAAFRSLSRPSSAPSARASTLCSFCLTASTVHSVALLRPFFFWFSCRTDSHPLSSVCLPLMSSYPSMQYILHCGYFFGIQFSRCPKGSLPTCPAGTAPVRPQPVSRTFVFFRKRCLAATYLPGASRPGIVSRKSLYRRVRDGNGCFPFPHRHQTKTLSL